MKLRGVACGTNGKGKFLVAAVAFQEVIPFKNDLILSAKNLTPTNTCYELISVVTCDT
jgi:hypothetical protein